ncbi:MAG: hypothetical protein LBI55_00260 [Oscillospiraceae bacterium]|jgi:hypothetical protein|nr:hypothetical protein [Oscillospiraceae bacterium]
MFGKKNKSDQSELEKDSVNDSDLENVSGGVGIHQNKDVINFWLDNRSGIGFEGEIESVIEGCKQNGLNFVSVPLLRSGIKSRLNKMDNVKRVDLQIKILPGGFFSIESFEARRV